MLYNYSPSIRIKISQEIVNKNCDQLTIDFEDVLRENINNYNGRDYLNIAPKEQPPRKLSGKRTAKINILERDNISPKEQISQVPIQMGSKDWCL